MSYSENHGLIRWFIVLSFGLALLAAGCGHSHSCEGHSHDPECLACHGDEDSFAPGTLVQGSEGLGIEIVSATPSPHEEGSNVLLIRVLDAAGEPVEDVTFTRIETFMADGGHGSPLEPVATATATPGEYEVTMIHYIHAGRWTLTFDMDAAGLTDTVQLLFCVEGVDG